VASRICSSIAIRLLTVALPIFAVSQVVVITRLVHAEAAVRELRDAA
jgi:hypothetical protein